MHGGNKLKFRPKIWQHPKNVIQLVLGLLGGYESKSEVGLMQKNSFPTNKLAGFACQTANQFP